MSKGLGLVAERDIVGERGERKGTGRWKERQRVIRKSRERGEMREKERFLKLDISKYINRS